jgi:hypothetical protein
MTCQTNLTSASTLPADIQTNHFHQLNINPANQLQPLPEPARVGSSNGKGTDDECPENQRCQVRKPSTPERSETDPPSQ